MGFNTETECNLAASIPLTMKLLVVHNSYQQRGGEDAVAEAEVSLLRSHGHDVEFYNVSNAAIGDMSKPALALTSIWSENSQREIGLRCDSFAPDLVHAHNTFPLVSPSLFWLAAQKRIPVIHTLHNFRPLCPQAMFLREGKPCEACLSHPPWRAVVHRCYHDSALESAVVATTLGVHRIIGTYRDKVSAYIVPSQFGREKYIAGGFPADRIHVKPNFVAASGTPAWDNRKHAVFVGRLSTEKGLTVLIDALTRLRSCDSHDARHAEALRIMVIGAGPMEALVAEQFGNDYLGRKTPADVLAHLHGARFAIVPSICYESFGLTVVESFSCGVPVIASAHGGVGELVEDGKTGLLFRPGDAGELAQKIQWATRHPEEMVRMGKAAYREYLEKYTPQRNYQALRDIYRGALSISEKVSYA